jgi:hypothetical protein
MLKSILGVVVGYVIFAASGVALFQLSGQDPHGDASVPFMVGAIAYGATFALLGGYVSGWIASRRPFAHGLVVAGILALGAGVSLAAMLGKGYIWSQVAALTVMAPAAAFGGWLRGRVASVAHPGAAPNRGRHTGFARNQDVAGDPGR